jgi:two-component system invasion response regulator UvrY
MPMTRVILVDDQPLVRDIVREILSDAPEISVVGEAGNGEEMMSLLARQACDLLLLDISLPGKNGFQLLEFLCANLPGMPVLMLSTHSDEHYITRSMAGGAAGYVQKRHAAERLVDTIRTIMQPAAGLINGTS